MLQSKGKDCQTEFKKQDPALQEIHFEFILTGWKLKGWKKYKYTAQRNRKRVEMNILILYEIYFKTKQKKRDKEGHFIILKRSVQQRYSSYKCVYTEHRYLK